MTLTSISAKKCWLLFLFLISCLNAATAIPAIKITPAPSWILSVTPSGKPASAKDFSDGYYETFSDKQVHLEKKTTYVHFIRQIASESGVQNGSEVSVYFDPSYEQIQFHNITVWRGGKSVSQVKESDFKVIPIETDRQRFIYNGYYSASVILKDIRKGDRIEYSFSRIGWNPVFQNKYSGIFGFSAYDYVSHMHYAIIAGAARKLYFKDFVNPPKNTVRKVNDENIYEWDLKNVKSIPYEDYSPSWNNNQPFVQITEFKNWEDVVNWGLQFYSDPVVSSPLKAKIEEWKRLPNASDHTYIENAVHFVQDEIRYLGMEMGENSHKPHSPDEVFNQRYGDCKDKAFLLCAILRANNIEADPVLVDTYKRGHILEYLPTPTDFNHVICRVKINENTRKDGNVNEFTFIDATYAMQGGTATKFYLPNYEHGLLLKSGQSDVVYIPEQNSGNVTVEEEIVVPLQTDSSETGSLITKTIYFEGEADEIRSQFQQNNMSETEENYVNYYRNMYKHAEFDMIDSLEYYDQREANNFSLIERYSMKNGWKYDSTRQKYIFSIVGKILYDQLIILPNKPRKGPVALRYPYHLEYKIRLRLPGPWNVPADDWTVKRAAYEIHTKSTFISSENVWELSYDYTTLRDHVTVDEIGQFRKDMEKLTGNLEYELTNPDGISLNTSNLNFWMIGFALIVLAISVWLCIKLYHYSPVTQMQLNSGISFGGWLVVLGIGIILKPFLILITFFRDLSVAYFTMTGWNVLQEGNPKVLSFHIWLLIEMTFNISMFCASILLIVLFFRKRNSFPELFSKVLALTVLFLVVDTAVASWLLGNNSGSFYDSTIAEVGRQIIYAAIWIPYMYKSQRIKDTFVNSNESNQMTGFIENSEVNQMLD